MRRDMSILMKKIHDLKKEVDIEQERAGAFGFLPSVANVLEQMIEEISAPRMKRDRIAGALGRLVTEDYAFSESELGGKLLELADEYGEM